MVRQGRLYAGTGCPPARGLILRAHALVALPSVLEPYLNLARCPAQLMSQLFTHCQGRKLPLLIYDLEHHPGLVGHIPARCPLFCHVRRRGGSRFAITIHRSPAHAQRTEASR